MFCPNCGAQSNANFCPNCGQNLQQPTATPQPQVNVVISRPMNGITCPVCHSVDVTAKKRGYSLLGGLIGFLCLPPFGLLFGLIGAKKLKCDCRNCKHSWKRDP